MKQFIGRMIGGFAVVGMALLWSAGIFAIDDEAFYKNDKKSKAALVTPDMKNLVMQKPEWQRKPASVSPQSRSAQWKLVPAPKGSPVDVSGSTASDAWKRAPYFPRGYYWMY